MADKLKRELGTFGAVTLGLGSIVGTGVFVSLGQALSLTGAFVLPAILLAACVATCNGLSSAQLAATHPVSGGTYEYGYEFLNPSLGFTAGWMFLCAKSASAATAALGVAAYFRNVWKLADPRLIAPLVVGVLTLLVLSGVKKSNTVTVVIVSLIFLTFLFYFGVGESAFERIRGHEHPPPFSANTFFYATALMFVAYTGYGRIATMGEEARNPRRTIPRAIITVLIASAVLYGLVAWSFKKHGWIASAAPDYLTRFDWKPSFDWFPGWLSVVAMLAMVSVLINLILGLSRVALAMGRRGDLPAGLAAIDETGTSPRPAVIFVGVLVLALTMIGDVKTTWSFSAFTVLIYYSITNLAALRLTPEQRLYPRWVSLLGLASCLFLAFWVPANIWLVGLGLIAAGLVFHAIRRRGR